jgi:hypothetical protein
MSDVLKTLVLATMTSMTLCAQSTASIEGRVTNGVTGEVVAGVDVRFLDRHSYVYRTTTDSTGSVSAHRAQRRRLPGGVHQRGIFRK